MNLEFPTQVPFPLDPTRPAADDGARASACLEAISDFLNLGAQRNPIPPSFDSAGSCLDHSNQEGICRGPSAEVIKEAISAVVGQIARQTKDEYVWDFVQHSWVMKVIPI